MPHYLGGKLGRSSSRSIFPSIHLTPQALPRAATPAPAIPRSRSPRLDFAGEKRNEPCYPLRRSVCLSLSFSFSFTYTLVSTRSLYIVYFRIGSLSTRNPPPSPLSYGPIVVFSPSLLPSPPESTAAPPQFSVSSEQRERVTIYSGDLRDRDSSALSSRAANLSSPPFRSPSEHCPTSPSIGPVRTLSVPRRTPTTLSSRSYTL